jgi:hypothetical protein
MGAVFLDFSTKQGEKKRLATKVRNLDSSNRKQRAEMKREAIENTYSMRIDRANEQRNTRKAKRKK